MKKIKILHIFKKLDRGGAELRTIEVMKYSDHERFEFHFCVYHKQIGSLEEYIIQLGGVIHRCELSLMFPFSFRKLLKENNFDVVHSHVYLFSGYIAKLAFKEKVIRRIVHFRSTSSGAPSSLRRNIQDQYFKYCINKYSTHILGVCEGALESIMGEGWNSDSRCRVIYNGIDTERVSQLEIHDSYGVRSELGIPQDALLFIHVGRVIQAKNHLRLISIFKNISIRCPNAILLLVGSAVDTEIEKEVLDLIKQLNLEVNVIILGEREDVLNLINSSNLLLLPSVREGLPGAILEALAVGVPVVASELPGAVEIARQIPYVHLIPLENSDDDWAEQILGFKALQDYPYIQGDIIKSFKMSEFTMGKCVIELSGIWSN